MLVTAAALGDRFGRRRLYAVGLVGFALASVASALSPNVEWLIASRAVQGVAAAFMMSLGLALLAMVLSIPWPGLVSGRVLFRGLGM